MSGRDREPASRESYRRLPGRSWGLLGKTSLWQGSDHILQVQSRGYSETYRRFYFREIQALLLRPTTRSRNLSLLLLSLTLLAFAAALAGLAPGAIFWTVVWVPLAIALLVQAPGGPSCVVHVRTAIETSELSALCRRGAADRSLAAIVELVESVQGAATAEEEALFVETAAAAPVPPPPPTSSPTSAVPWPDSAQPSPPPLPGARSLRWHWGLFLLLLGDAALSAGQILAPGQLLGAVALGVGLGELALAIAALVAGRGQSLDPRLRRATVAALVYVCAAFVASWVSSIVTSFQAAAAGTLRPGVLPGQAVVPWLAGATIPIALGLGAWGLFLLRRTRAATFTP